MQSVPRSIALVMLAALLGAAAPADSPIGVQEPDGLYTGPQQGYVPSTLRGATVIDLAGLDALLAKAKPVLLDVGLADRKPDNLPPGTLWLPTHRSIPGAIWMPNAGEAPMPQEKEAALLARVATLTGGDKARPVVVFCHPECWGSWNAGKRLVGGGYTAVHWFPLGVEGWQDTHETTALKPDADWTKAAGETAKKSEPER